MLSRLLNEQGQAVAQWLLLTNTVTPPAATLVLWYYWRWQIESFFKLLKSAGHQLETWQQESAQAVAKCLLVTSMACVTVWAIAASPLPNVQQLRQFLIRLSGRQMRHKVEFTYPALLAGLLLVSLPDYCLDSHHGDHYSLPAVPRRRKFRSENPSAESTMWKHCCRK